MVFTRADGSSRRAAGAHGARRRRHRAEHHLREGTPRLVLSSTASRSSSRASKPFAPSGANWSRVAAFTLEPDPNGFFTSHDTDGKFVSYYGDNHPRYNGNVVKAMASAKDGYPHVVDAVRRSHRRARSRPSSRNASGRGTALGRHARRPAARARRARRAADADDRRGDRPRAGGGAALPSRPVLSPAELRAAQPARPRRRSRGVAADGRHRAHRRVGRPRAGPAVADHARDGRVEPAVRVSASPASRSS